MCTHFAPETAILSSELSPSIRMTALSVALSFG